MTIPRPGVHAAPPSGDPRFAAVDRTLKRFQYRQDALIEVLHTAQEVFGHLNDEVMAYVAGQLKLPESWVFGVATFYHFFSLKPQGEHTCTVCMGTACYVKQASEVMAALRQEFGVEAGQTTEDGQLTVLTTRCIGTCGLAPVLLLDGEVIGREKPESIVERVRTLVAQGKTEGPPAGGERFQPRGESEEAAP